MLVPTHSLKNATIIILVAVVQIHHIHVIGALTRELVLLAIVLDVLLLPQFVILPRSQLNRSETFTLITIRDNSLIKKFNFTIKYVLLLNIVTIFLAFFFKPTLLENFRFFWIVIAKVNSIIFLKSAICEFHDSFSRLDLKC